MAAASSLWATELDGILAKTSVLDRLVVLKSSEVEHGVVTFVESLTPRQLGLSAQANRGPDWELLRGGLFYAANDLERAHTIFQEIESSQGAYWHGMLHRREGDFPNALYWIRRAGRVQGISGLADFSPAAFVLECEAAIRRSVEPEHLLETQRREWEAMMSWSWSKLEAAC
jgi:hypothetical protein